MVTGTGYQTFLLHCCPEADTEKSRLNLFKSYFRKPFMNWKVNLGGLFPESNAGFSVHWRKSINCKDEIMKNVLSSKDIF